MDTEKIRQQFDDQGYVIFKGFLGQDVVHKARSGVERLVDQLAEKLLAAGKIPHLFKDEPFATRLFLLYKDHLDDMPKVLRRELHLPEFFYLFFHPRLLDLVEIVIGGEIRLYPNYSCRPKLPEWEGTEVLWHQDGGYTLKPGISDKEVEALRMVNVWTPLVPARVENGCMQFIPGTHKLGNVRHERRKYYLEIADEYLKPRVHQAIDIELDPGDVVVFHNLLFHRGQPNRSQGIRWSFDWRYQDATQDTLRAEVGHLARSRRHPASAVQSAEEWARLTYR